MRMHRCAEIRCTELIPMKYDYCQKHYEARMQRFNQQRLNSQELSSRTLRGQQKLREATQSYDETTRQELHDGFYQSKQWEKIASYVKQRDGYLDGVDGKAWDKGDLIVDHVVPRRLLGRDEQLNTDNLWLLTRSQHNHKTAVEKKLNDNQLKNISKNWWIKILKK
ncbi:HNH endonuclease [Weissella coleopterorum]|uniref:HNH endonuclease n=2 Tax=Weissella coleopterorum TaxID=2714949 RepID=A0A6G8B1X9_9LACO|nr:HNH endonuclease [Weissella coleopterorum]QIL51240.1 HNH endonuclease [Weissella coleopterorum]